MGMSGASKAKREAKKQMAAAYYDALKKVEKATPIKRIDTQSARKLSDQMDGDISYGTKRIAMKADKLGRTINADKSLNKDIESYNKRVDEMKGQMKGKTINKYEVVQDSDTSVGISGLLNNSALKGQSSIGKFDNMEEANAANPNPKIINKNPIFGMNQESSNSYFGKTNDPTYSVKETNLTPISRNYRELAGTKGAYDDLEKLSKNVGANPASALTKNYEALGNQLRSKLKREVSNVSAKPAGLLGSELASAAPVQEVIA
jgi:hypothetical protein